MKRLKFKVKAGKKASRGLREQLKRVVATLIVVNALVVTVLLVSNLEIVLGEFSANMETTVGKVYVELECSGWLAPWKSSTASPINVSAGISVGNILLSSHPAVSVGNNTYIVDFSFTGEISYIEVKPFLLSSGDELTGILNYMFIELKLNVTYINEGKSTSASYKPTVARILENDCYELRYTPTLRDYYSNISVTFCYRYLDTTLRVVNNEEGALNIELDIYRETGEVETVSISAHPKSVQEFQLGVPLRRLKVRSLSLNYGFYWVDVRGEQKVLSLVKNAHIVLIPVTAAVFAVYTIPGILARYKVKHPAEKSS